MCYHKWKYTFPHHIFIFIFISIPCDIYGNCT